MSFRASQWAKEQTAGGSLGKLLLRALADYADESGRCFPGQARLAVECECSERAVREWLGRLEEAGLIRRERRSTEGGHRTSDTIALALDLPANPAGGQPADIAAGQPAECAGGLPANPAEPTGTDCRGTYQENLSGQIGGGAGAGAAERKPPKPSRVQIMADFADWYSGFPNKVGRRAAEKAYLGARERGASAEDLVRGVASYRVTKPPHREWCHPSTWLNQDRWKDEPAPPVQNPDRRAEHVQGGAVRGGGRSISDTIAEHAERRRQEFARLKAGG